MKICFSSTGLTWSQCEDSYTLHALPSPHSTNIEFGGVYSDFAACDHATTTAGIEDVGGDDFDCSVDCGDFVF